MTWKPVIYHHLPPLGLDAQSHSVLPALIVGLCHQQGLNTARTCGHRRQRRGEVAVTCTWKEIHIEVQCECVRSQCVNVYFSVYIFRYTEYYIDVRRRTPLPHVCRLDPLLRVIHHAPNTALLDHCEIRVTSFHKIARSKPVRSGVCRFYTVAPAPAAPAPAPAAAAAAAAAKCQTAELGGESGVDEYVILGHYRSGWGGE